MANYDGIHSSILSIASKISNPNNSGIKIHPKIAMRNPVVPNGVLIAFYGFGADQLRVRQGLFIPSPYKLSTKFSHRSGMHIERVETIGSKSSHKAGIHSTPNKTKTIGSKAVRIRQGYWLKPVQEGPRKLNNKLGVFISQPNHIGDMVLRRRTGLYLDPYHFDSNASNHVDLLVTPTFTLEGSSITVSVENRRMAGTIGKYSLQINKTEVVPYAEDSADLSELTFEMDVSLLSVGDNACVLFFGYDDGDREYLEFVVTKEAVGRTVVLHTFKRYTGGYSTNGIMYDAQNDAFISSYPQPNGLIVTTDKTSIDLKRCTGIIGVNQSSYGALFYVSFDKRNIWLYFDGTSWQTISNLEDIATNGMTGQVLSALTKEQWDTVFQRTQLDFAAYLDPSLSAYYQTDKTQQRSIPNGTFIIPDGETLYRVIVPGRVLVSTYLHVYDKNDNLIYTYETHNGSIDYTHDMSKMPAKKIEIGGPSGGTITTYISIKAVLSNIQVLMKGNSPPAIINVLLSPTSVHKENTTLTAHIADADGDQAQYRVLVNGSPLSDFVTNGVEYDISVDIPNELFTVGTNAIEIQTYDGNLYNSYTTYLTKIDALPTVSGVINELTLTASINDADGDTVRYRILLNGVEKEAWSPFMAVPFNIGYIMQQKDIVVGYQNTLTVEVEDDLGQQTLVDFDFVGQNYKKGYAFII